MTLSIHPGGVGILRLNETISVEVLGTEVTKMNLSSNELMTKKLLEPIRTAFTEGRRDYKCLKCLASGFLNIKEFDRSSNTYRIKCRRCEGTYAIHEMFNQIEGLEAMIGKYNENQKKMIKYKNTKEKNIKLEEFEENKNIRVEGMSAKQDEDSTKPQKDIVDVTQPMRDRLELERMIEEKICDITNKVMGRFLESIGRKIDEKIMDGLNKALMEIKNEAMMLKEVGTTVRKPVQVKSCDQQDKSNEDKSRPTYAEVVGKDSDRPKRYISDYFKRTKMMDMEELDRKKGEYRATKGKKCQLYFSGIKRRPLGQIRALARHYGLDARKMLNISFIGMSVMDVTCFESDQAQITEILNKHQIKVIPDFDPMSIDAIKVEPKFDKEVDQKLIIRAKSEVAKDRYRKRLTAEIKRLNPNQMGLKKYFEYRLSRIDEATNNRQQPARDRSKTLSEIIMQKIKTFEENANDNKPDDEINKK